MIESKAKAEKIIIDPFELIDLPNRRLYHPQASHLKTIYLRLQEDDKCSEYSLWLFLYQV